jgi:hypothetical protein
MARDIGVYPRDEHIKAHLKHPIGRGFENFPAATPWPFDQFTMRRLEEGAVVTETKEAAQ